MSNFKEQLKDIKAFVFDVDGVFANENLFFHPSGEPMRSMNIKDGYAVQLAIKEGYPIAIITGSKTEAIRTRFQGLGVTDIYLGSCNKIENFKDFLSKYQLKPEDILYMGDDLPDYQVMSIVGVPTCPANSAQEIKSISKYISNQNGGEGCVRDVIEQVLRVQNKWMNMNAFKW
jgi:3-deoxy-D-manno-octulosonate 8-phosphate phosphatase (KDO 8-P phosphatase)